MFEFEKAGHPARKKGVKMEKELKTKQDFNEAMQELSKSLGSWPHIKKSFLAIEKIPESDRDDKQKKTVKKYNKLKPIREQVKALKEQRDKLFGSPPAFNKKEFKKKELTIPEIREKVIFYQRLLAAKIRESQTDNVKRQAERVQSRSISSGYSSGFFKSEIQSGIWAKKR